MIDLDRMLELGRLPPLSAPGDSLSPPLQPPSSSSADSTAHSATPSDGQPRPPALGGYLSLDHPPPPPAPGPSNAAKTYRSSKTLYAIAPRPIRRGLKKSHGPLPVLPLRASHLKAKRAVLVPPSPTPQACLSQTRPAPPLPVLAPASDRLTPATSDPGLDLDHIPVHLSGLDGDDAGLPRSSSSSTGSGSVQEAWLGPSHEDSEMLADGTMPEDMRTPAVYLAESGGEEGRAVGRRTAPITDQDLIVLATIVNPSNEHGAHSTKIDLKHIELGWLHQIRQGLPRSPCKRNLLNIKTNLLAQNKWPDLCFTEVTVPSCVS